MIFLGVQEDIVASAHYRHIFNISSYLIGVIVDKTADLHLIGIGLYNVPQDHLPRRSGADDHNMLSGFAIAGHFNPIPLQKHKTVGKPHRRQQNKLQHRAEKIVGERHTMKQHGNANCVKNTGNQCRRAYAHQFIVAGKPPDAVIEPQKVKYNQRKDDIDR